MPLDPWRLRDVSPWRDAAIAYVDAGDDSALREMVAALRAHEAREDEKRSRREALVRRAREIYAELEALATPHVGAKPVPFPDLPPHDPGRSVFLQSHSTYQGGGSLFVPRSDICARQSCDSRAKLDVPELDGQRARALCTRHAKGALVSIATDRAAAETGAERPWASREWTATVSTKE